MINLISETAFKHYCVMSTIALNVQDSDNNVTIWEIKWENQFHTQNLLYKLKDKFSYGLTCGDSKVKMSSK